MGYIKIPNLYKCIKYLEFFGPNVYAMEKIHGTSTWIYARKNSDNSYTIRYHSGGESANTFNAIFDKPVLEQNIIKLMNDNNYQKFKIHGECYGGKQQKMASTYGPILKFIAFDVNVQMFDNTSLYLDVEDAEKIAKQLNLEFVHYTIGPSTPEWLEAETIKKSVQAMRNGMGNDKVKEGIVIRPIHEIILPNGERAIAKHKTAEFMETGKMRSLHLSNEEIEIEKNVNKIAEDWITSMRADHVIDKMLHKREIKIITIKDMKLFIDSILDDVKIEATDEIEWNDELILVMKKYANNVFKQKLKNENKI
jgi:hypothetical protein